MNTFTFIFLICLYALFFIYQALGGVEIESQILYSSILILAFGIPHGAIDHILYFKKRDTSPAKFYTIYLGLILLFVVLWMYQPMLSFIFFLVISAFHFGESQFADLSIRRSTYSLLLYIVWGLTLLLNLIYYNVSELNDLTAFFKDTEAFQSFYNHNFITYGFVSLNGIILVMLAYLLYSKHFSWNRLLSEVFLLALIHLTFYLFPFIIGFTLYFVVLHSIRVMNYEYKFFKKEKSNFRLIDFIKLLMPYTLLSVFFTVVILLLSHKGIIPISVPLLSLVIISVITLPHAIVMHIFYHAK